jgi:hypothetical protein
MLASSVCYVLGLLAWFYQWSRSLQAQLTDGKSILPFHMRGSTYSRRVYKKLVDRKNKHVKSDDKRRI